jgi:integrase
MMRERPAFDDAETIGATLDESQLIQLVRDFRATSLHGFVAVACLTGMGRNEILALRWVDVNFEAATISVTRSVEQTKKHGRRGMTPKTANSVRTFKIDDALVAGIPDGAEVDLSLVKLPVP